MFPSCCEFSIRKIFHVYLTVVVDVTVAHLPAADYLQLLKKYRCCSCAQVCVCVFACVLQSTGCSLDIECCVCEVNFGLRWGKPQKQSVKLIILGVIMRKTFLMHGPQFFSCPSFSFHPTLSIIPLCYSSFTSVPLQAELEDNNQITTAPHLVISSCRGITAGKLLEKHPQQ